MKFKKLLNSKKILYGIAAIIWTAVVICAATLIIPKPNSKPKLLSEEQQLPKYTNPDDCAKPSFAANKVECWNISLKYVTQKLGITAAFNVYTSLYNSDPYFAENCHGFTHTLGEAAYKKYKNHEDFDVSAQVSYCSYGFFHGFIEAMFQDQGNLDQARDFCDYIDKKLNGQTSALGACIHGIGHGVTDGSDSSAWGNVFALIEPGKKLCVKIAKTNDEIERCATGIFNSLEGLYQDPKYKIQIDKNDPFWICRQQETMDFKRACYDDFKDIIMVITGNNFLKAAHFIEGIKEDNYAQWAIDNLATYDAYFILRKPNYDYAINDCHKLQKRLLSGCIAGLGAGFMTAGSPGQEYVKALELCRSNLISGEERSACFQRVLHASWVQYSPEKHNQVCTLAGVNAKLSQDCN